MTPAGSEHATREPSGGAAPGPSGEAPPPATRELARFAAELRYEDLPGDVVAHMKLCVLDAIGCAVFGAGLPWTRLVAELAVREGGGPEAVLVGLPYRTTASMAALVNGTAGHAFELDDIHMRSILHPGSLCFPAALALAESSAGGLSGRDFLVALVAGYEVGTRVGMAATSRLFFRGFHPQGTTGVFAAAATAARALGLGPEAATHALGIAGSQAAGLMAAQEGAMIKRFHSGRAAQSGVYGALLAARGFTGIPDVLEAPFGGFLAALSGSPEPEALTRGLGERWETRAVGFKAYAAVTSTHAALDALAGIMAEHGLAAADVAAVDVGVASLTHQHCAWEYRAQGATAAQMNLAYGLAVMALDGDAFVEQYREERLADPVIREFIGRVRAHVDPAIDDLGPGFRHAARVAVRLRDGRLLEREVLHRRGSPENPLSQGEVLDKLRRLAGHTLGPDRLDAVVATVDSLETLADVAVLAPLITVA